jgi:LAS superfamily LD-carboxypeptidase LdcB
MPLYASAAQYNAAAETGLLIAPFGRNEMGWQIYAPLAAATLPTSCPAGSEGFARALALWQTQHGLPGSGALTADTLQTFKGVWQERRPFLMLRLRNICPPPPPDADLETLTEAESYGGKTVQLRRGAAEAYRRMVEAARRDDPAIAADPALLTVFSGYRSPDYDAARCAIENNCQGLVRAACSAHRTGLTLDIDVGAEPGFTLDSSADSNRLVQTQGPAYRWLVKNAGRFGFVNYAFEPWHWEWTGEAP